jgi:hypothetical protein
MRRQQTTPLLLSESHPTGQPLRALSLGLDGHGLDEASIQEIVQANPDCLPIKEIDPLFLGPIPICTELGTPAGPIDNFMVTASGLPILVECKLWKNPQSRREVVGQILDYAKELSRWSSADLQREVSKRLGKSGNVMLELVRAAGNDVDEAEFNDSLTLNLRRGRFLLLIIGDGIRDGVETIAEYLQAHASLHFTLGLVEMAIYAMPSGEKLIVPRILARTEKIVRTVVEAPAGFQVDDDVRDPGGDDSAVSLSPEQLQKKEDKRLLLAAERLAFWKSFVDKLRLDDPEQALPNPTRNGYITIDFPAPDRSSWLTIYRSKADKTVGLFLSGSRNSPGETAAKQLEVDADAIRAELGEQTDIRFDEDWPQIADRMTLTNFSDSPEREAAFIWLRRRTNDFVNALRPRIRDASSETGA